jgi:hypothetical protein
MMTGRSGWCGARWSAIGGRRSHGARRVLALTLARRRADLLGSARALLMLRASCANTGGCALIDDVLDMAGLIRAPHGAHLSPPAPTARHGRCRQLKMRIG